MEIKQSIKITTVEERDLPTLAELAKAAFLEDDQYKPPGAEVEGPPGHDSIETHQEWLKTTIYLKLSVKDHITAACSYERNGNVGEIVGLFVHPDFMNKGLGTRLLSSIFQKERSVSKWWLETPDYAVRNHRFYTKNGFRKSRQKPMDPDIGFGFHIYER